MTSSSMTTPTAAATAAAAAAAASRAFALDPPQSAEPSVSNTEVVLPGLSPKLRPVEVQEKNTDQLKCTNPFLRVLSFEDGNPRVAEIVRVFSDVSNCPSPTLAAVTPIDRDASYGSVMRGQAGVDWGSQQQ